VRKQNVSEPTYYTWKRKYGGAEVREVRRSRGLEEEKDYRKANRLEQ